VGNYSAYEKTREVELESLLKRYAAQQEEIEKTQALIERFRYKASKAAFAQELIKRLEKMEPIVIPESLKKINITFPPPPHSGRIALTLEGIGKSYGTHQVLSGLDLIIESGEKLLVAGVNGAGKTTLLRILAGEDSSFEGEVKYGAGIVPGYFSQDAAETLTGSRSVLEYLEAEAPTHLIPRLRDMLGAFLFRGDDVYKSLTVLSGGEKSRLALLRMLLKPLNLLILDEPTNHLDLHSKDILLDCLRAFTGTVIFVSHDRGFMEALSTKTLSLSSGRHCLYYGGYGYFLERMEAEHAGKPLETDAGPLVNGAADSDDTSDVFSSAEYRAEEKQRQTLIRRLRREETGILEDLEKLEQEKAVLEAQLSRPDVYSSAEKARQVTRKLAEINLALDAKNNEWEAKAAELEKCEATTRAR
jgi:ATP-binding cassette subfamily F protein 3